MATVITNKGREWITGILASASNGTPTQTAGRHIGWGVDPAPPTAARTHTALDTEDSGGSPAYARVAGVVSQETTTTTKDTYRVVGTITSNGSKTVTNAGYFDASSGGNLIIKGDHAGIPLLANDSIQYTFDLHFT